MKKKKYDEPLYIWCLTDNAKILKYTLYEYEKYIDYSRKIRYKFAIKDGNNNLRIFDVSVIDFNRVNSYNSLPIFISKNDIEDSSIHDQFKYYYDHFIYYYKADIERLTDNLENVQTELSKAQNIYQNLLTNDTIIKIKSPDQPGCPVCRKIQSGNYFTRIEIDDIRIDEMKYCPECGRKLFED